MSELLPCPFCGGEAITRLADRAPFRGMLHSWYVTCMNDRCGCELGFYGMDENGTCGTYETEEEAIAAWNTRAERTCHNDHGHCDKCGSLLVLKGNYCFNCGAKVIDGMERLWNYTESHLATVCTQTATAIICEWRLSLTASASGESRNERHAHRVHLRGQRLQMVRPFPDGKLPLRAMQHSTRRGVLRRVPIRQSMHFALLGIQEPSGTIRNLDTIMCNR